MKYYYQLIAVLVFLFGFPNQILGQDLSLSLKRSINGIDSIILSKSFNNYNALKTGILKIGDSIKQSGYIDYIAEEVIHTNDTLYIAKVNFGKYYP
ncbi:MAG: hypothetical protein V7767_11320, partial [Leeuwenhoekiella sp.]